MILFSAASNVRAIPSIIDGLKPGQRKILYTALSNNLVKEMKVAQFAALVAKQTNYHHGETALATTVVNMAQDFVGSNNIPLLSPNGQFGTRLAGGKDCASARYIFTQLQAITRLVFHADDDPLLTYLHDDGQVVEPHYYVPIIPMVLVNGCAGIGTGYSTNVPNHNPIDIINNIYRLMDGLEPDPMVPCYKGFRGQVKPTEVAHKYSVTGVVHKLSNSTVHITELPVGVWTNDYKTKLDKWVARSMVQGYSENHTDATVDFTVSLTIDQMAAAEKVGLATYFELQDVVSTNNMVLYNHDGRLRKYNNTLEILQEFYNVRLDLYEKRKRYLEEKLGYEVEKIANKVRFIETVSKGTIMLGNIKKEDLVARLQRDGFVQFTKSFDDKDGSDKSYDYLLLMSILSLTLEHVVELQDDLHKKQSLLQDLQQSTPTNIWKNDLQNLLVVVRADDDQSNVDHPKKKIKI